MGGSQVGHYYERGRNSGSLAPVSCSVSEEGEIMRILRCKRAAESGIPEPGLTHRIATEFVCAR